MSALGQKRDITSDIAMSALRPIATCVAESERPLPCARARVRARKGAAVRTPLTTMGKYLVPGTPLGEHTAAEIRQIVTNLH
jgi:hypothetical protein